MLPPVAVIAVITPPAMVAVPRSPEEPGGVTPALVGSVTVASLT
jgi:hypothetical protein